MFRSHDHAFAGCQSVRFEHHRSSPPAESCFGGRAVVADHKIGGGDVVAAQELFRKDFARFQLSRSLHRPCHAQSLPEQFIGKTSRQRSLRPDHGEIGAQFGGELRQSLRILQLTGQAHRFLRHAAIAGDTEYFLDGGALAEFPHQSMLSSSGPNDQYLQGVPRLY